MTDENTLRLKAREALQSGKLPHSKPERMWGGPGIGARCALCLDPVSQEELGFELQFAPQDLGADEDSHHIHLRCFAAWDSERRVFELASVRGHINPRHPLHSAASGSEQIHVVTTQPVLSDSDAHGTISAPDERTVSAGERKTRRGGREV